MIDFRTSSYCSIGGCVAVGRSSDGGVLVRDTKKPEQPPLEFDADEWAAFVAGVKAGEFDLHRL